MELLGVRFKNYACFDDCYLPLARGIQVLVGKNNAGKTALLRGLTVLNCLPVEPLGDALDNRLSGYTFQNSGAFEVRIRARPDDNDYKYFGGLEAWRLSCGGVEAFLELDFVVFADTNVVGLSTARIVCGSKELPIFQVVGPHFVRITRSANGSAAGNLVVSEKGRRTAHDSQWPWFQGDLLLDQLAKFRNFFLIDAHRIVTPESNFAAVESLPPNASSLGPFLDTLQGNRRHRFEEIERFVTRVFPEFRYVNPEKRANVVFLTLTRRDNGKSVPLSHCGTGVEQVLALATFVLTAPPKSRILLDEPHSYLHPTAEHDVISFLLEHTEHDYVIATHSAIFINAVSADRIVSVSPSGVEAIPRKDPSEIAAVLHSLGYRNSDFLFSDRLVFVEGESDQEILPVLLSRNPECDRRELDRTGFPVMGGEGKLRGTAKQTSVMHFEKMLDELGEADLPRVYMFDGDCEREDRSLLEKTPYFKERPEMNIRFLKRREIENYLLVPDAICTALGKLAIARGSPIGELDSVKIQASIERILAADDAKLYPNGKVGGTDQAAKGSVVLERLFEEYGMAYNKRRTGLLVAEHVTAQNQPALPEIWSLVRDVFPEVTGSPGRY